jgi:serine/threonine-protein kinase RIO1
MPRGSIYTVEQIDNIIKRVEQFKEENSDATRASLARYAGVDISVLKRLEKQGKLTLPKPLTRKQQTKRNVNWTKSLGKLRTW